MNNEKPQNPNAFPEMTLRDYFAAKAMQAMCKLYDPELISKKAYQIADAMLKQREL